MQSKHLLVCVCVYVFVLTFAATPSRKFATKLSGNVLVFANSVAMLCTWDGNICTLTGYGF